MSTVLNPKAEWSHGEEAPKLAFIESLWFSKIYVEIIRRDSRYYHCFGDDSTIFAQIFVCWCLCASSIMSNFHNLEIASGADMVIQDRTAWIKSGLSGQQRSCFLTHWGLGLVLIWAVIGQFWWTPLRLFSLGYHRGLKNSKCGHKHYE